MDKIKGKPLTLICKIIAVIFFLGMIGYKVVATGDLTLSYVIAVGASALILANLFISVDISLWITNLKKIKEIDQP